MADATAILRFDASPAIGGGHAVRCLALADALTLSDWRCHLVVRPATASITPEIATAGHDVIVLGDDEASEPDQIAVLGPADLLVVDHYQRDAEFETACRQFVRRILVFDDLADRRHDCDLLLDPTPGRQSEDYAGLVPTNCRMLVGPAYAVLRPQFLAKRATARARRNSDQPVRRVLISAGAVDATNLTGRAIEAVVDVLPAAAVDVVLGAQAPNLDAIRRQVAALDQPIAVHVAVRDMAPLMEMADVAIGAAGASSLERCALGLPTLMVVTADNQRLLARNSAAAGAAILVGEDRDIDARALAMRLRQFCEDPPRRRAMAKVAAELCDARGTLRMLLALLPSVLARDGYPARLRLATAADEAIMLTWQRHPETRKFARVRDVPTPEGHHAWLASRLDDPKCILTVIEHDGAPAGVLRLDRQHGTDHSPTFEISILVAPGKHRQGLGRLALSLARGLVPGADLIAEVHPENTASTALFRAAEYVKGRDGRYRDCHRRMH